jgi:cation transport ATPase
MDSKALLQQLVAMSDYVVFGYPDATLIENLIRLKGRARVRLPVSEEEKNEEEENEEEEEEEEKDGGKYQIMQIRDNNMIEDNLEDEGLLCIEDLVFYLSPKDQREAKEVEEDKKQKKKKSKQKRKRGQEEEEQEEQESEEDRERAKMQTVILSFLVAFELQSPLSKMQCKTLKMQIPREEAHGYLAMEHLRSLLGKMV